MDNREIKVKYATPRRARQRRRGSTGRQSVTIMATEQHNVQDKVFSDTLTGQPNWALNSFFYYLFILLSFIIHSYSI